MKKRALIIGGSGGLSGRLATMAQTEYDVWVLTRGKRPLPNGVHPLTVGIPLPSMSLEDGLRKHLQRLLKRLDVRFCVRYNANDIRNLIILLYKYVAK